MGEMLTHVDLFSGIGGFALAAQWAGFRTVAFCEIELFCQEVLKARFGAIANTKSERLERRGHGETRIKKKAVRLFSTRSIKRPILYSDIRDFDGSRFRGATLLTGGVPCQPASIAGKRKGTADDRWLWPEAIRVLAEVKPTWVIFENPCGILSLEQGVVFEDLLSQMEGKGYEVRPIIIPACAVNAPHRRDRVWILAHIAQDALLGRNGRWGDGDTPRLRRALQTAGSNSDAPDTLNYLGQSSGTQQDKWGMATQDKQITEIAPDTKRFRLECSRGKTGIRETGEVSGREGGQSSPSTKVKDIPRTQPTDTGWEQNWPEVATRLCRVDARVSNRVDRLKALGNSIVPQVAYRIIKAIAEIKEDYLT